MPILSRRSMLAASAAGATLAGLPGALLGRAGAAYPAILKPTPPDRFTDFGTNAETLWGSVRRQDYLTDQADLFVRNHTSTPTIDASTWRLQLTGDGLDAPRVLSLAELRRLPRTRTTATLECTGNGRSFFGSQQGRPASGTAWKLGAVGAVQWEGVRLADVLDLAGLRDDAVSVLATGLDAPYSTGGVSYGNVRRPFPITKAVDDALLAWGANGEPLLPDHGYPVRLVLPGWVGIASIKWLGSLEVARTGLTSPWSTKWYRMTGGDFPADSPPLSVNPVRSAFELPWPAEISRQKKVRLTGRSWSGVGPIATVDVSTDGGATWRPARIHRGGRREAWTQWDVEWRAPAYGAHELLARATDVAGRTQPAVAAWNDNGYFFDAVVRHPVTVV